MERTPVALASALTSHYRLERELGFSGYSTMWLTNDLKGDEDNCLRWLEKATTEREPAIFVVQDMPLSDRLRLNPCFVALPKELGLIK